MTITLLNNRYQVIQVIGAGGFGETFLAEDTHLPSRRRCVIKQLKPITNNDPQTYKIIQQRFEREAATLEYLGESCNQIPKLYAYFSENGQFYLVQEWIHGQTLTNIIQAKGFEKEATVRQILLDLLSVLDYIHSKGIIHRDIKPDNIILRSLDNKPVLIDFGAVKETIRSVVNSPGYPTRSLVIGTPGYMPSEQAVGRPVYATDIYSLGLTAIYLLTGKHPQQLLTDLQNGEILWQQHAPNVSPQFRMVLNQAIKPHIGDRYSTASKMLHDLQPASHIPPQSAVNTSTVSLSPTAILTEQIQPLSSPQNTTIINGSGTFRNWQKPAVILGSLLVGGLIGAVAISGISRQQQPQTSIATSPTRSPESLPTPTSADPPVSSQTSPVPVVPTSPPQPQPTPDPLPASNPTVVSTPQPESEPVTSDTPVAVPASTPQPKPENEAIPAVVTEPTRSVENANASPTPEARSTPQNKPRSKLAATTSRQNVPAFPTGTPRNIVEATLGKPNQDLRGVWGRTRAVVYKLVPNKIDLGYLFDRNSKVLRQTEVAFAQSVDPQIMEATLNGLLSGQATEDIKQGLKQVQQRQSDNFSFKNGSVKGQIIRQQCDFIYISIWDADLHDFVNPSTAKKC